MADSNYNNIKKDCNDNCKLQVAQRGFVTMLSAQVSGDLGHYFFKHRTANVGCWASSKDRGPGGLKEPIVPYAPLNRNKVYLASREAGGFNHHSQITRFKGRYYLAWSNGVLHEDSPGQRILISSSDDAVNWSEPVCIAGDAADTITSHHCLALRAEGDELFVVSLRADTRQEAKNAGMQRSVVKDRQLLVYSSGCPGEWKEVFSFDKDIVSIFESPRVTSDGHLMCVASVEGCPAILRWPGQRLCEQPEKILIPQAEGACFPYGEGSWYQTDDDTVVVFWRDEGLSCRIWVNYSTDGGRTFGSPMMSDIPDSMSRVYAGRLGDGRFYLCNNAFGSLLDRRHLMLLISEDGYRFDKVYTLIDDPTSMRLFGYHKVEGYQYPCCMSDNGKLLAAYSVNKEDIECGIVDVNKI